MAADGSAAIKFSANTDPMTLQAFVCSLNTAGLEDLKPRWSRKSRKRSPVREKNV